MKWYLINLEHEITHESPQGRAGPGINWRRESDLRIPAAGGPGGGLRGGLPQCFSACSRSSFTSWYVCKWASLSAGSKCVAVL